MDNRKSVNPHNQQAKAKAAIQYLATFLLGASWVMVADILAGGLI